MKIVLSVWVCLLVAGSAMGQANSQPVLKPRGDSTVQDLPAPGESTKVAPDAAVITIKGVCEKSPSASTTADCNTVVTREQFEKLVNTVQPNLPKAQQKQLASRYAQFLVLADKAHEMGLDRGPTFDEEMYLARLQLLARMTSEHIQKDAARVSDADIDDYYKQHSGDFKTVSYDKIYVPKQKNGTTITPSDPDAQKKRQAAEEVMKEEADKLRARAAAGEDFPKLQQEAYSFAGMNLTASASNTHVDKVSKAHMLGNDASIFDLKKGEVSQVINDPQGFMIYKVVDLQEQPLSDVREEVSRAVQQQKLKSASEALQKQLTENTTYDDAYFAAPPPPTLRNPGEQAPATAPAPPAPGKK